MTIIQCDLRQLLPVHTSPHKAHGYRIMTTWLEKRDDVKEGSLVELKNVTGKWEIVRVYPGVHDMQEFNWHRKMDQQHMTTTEAIELWTYSLERAEQLNRDGRSIVLSLVADDARKRLAELENTKEVSPSSKEVKLA